MLHLAIIASRLRTGSKSQSDSLYFQHYLSTSILATTEIIYLKAFGFPFFDGTIKTSMT